MAGAAAAAGVAGGGDLAERAGSGEHGQSHLPIGDTPTDADDHNTSVWEGWSALQVKLHITIVTPASVVTRRPVSLLLAHRPRALPDDEKLDR
jgi:hypothetical protein